MENEQEQVIPGLDYLGRGYSIFDEYAAPSSLLGSLFNFKPEPENSNKIKPIELNRKHSIKDSPYYYWDHFVRVTSLNKTELRAISVDSTKALSKTKSRSAGVGISFLGFGAQIKTHSSSTEDETAHYKYTRTTDKISHYSLVLDIHSLEDDSSEFKLRDYLTKDFKKDIEEIDTKSDDKCAAFFEHYGLYFLTGAVMGAKATQTAVFIDKSKGEKHDFEVEAKLSYTKTIGKTDEKLDANADGKYGKGDSSNEQITLSASAINTVGGSSSGTIRDKASYDAWRAGIDNPSNIQFIDFTESTSGLTGIWILASTKEKRDALENAALRYAQRKNIEFWENNRRKITYTVTTYTGMSDNASTESQISVILNGKYGENSYKTEERKHDDTDNNHEQATLIYDSKGIVVSYHFVPKKHNKTIMEGVDCIDLKPVYEVGELTSIEVMSDGKGKDPGWELLTIKVENKYGIKKAYTADCNTWIFKDPTKDKEHRDNKENAKQILNDKSVRRVDSTNNRMIYTFSLVPDLE